MPNRREKSEALIMDREIQSYLVRTVAETSLISLRIFAAVRRAFIRGTDIGAAFHVEYMKTAPRLAELMLVGALLGIRRASVRAIGQDWSLSRSLWKETVSQHKLLMKIPVNTLREMKNQLGAQALAMTQRGSAVIERRLQKRVQRILEKDLHVKDGVRSLTKEFDELGLTPRHKAHLETLYRTQTHLAYAAGREVQEMDPDIDEILWGYKYVTVGDDRVRPEHAGLDGVTLPKDDPFWATNKPPNGWNCRCQAIPLFDSPEGGSVQPPDLFEGVKPGADKGFGFRASDVFDLRRPGSVAAGGLVVPPVPPRVLRKAVTVAGKHTSAQLVKEIQYQTAVVNRLARMKPKTAAGSPRKGLLAKKRKAREELADLKLKLKGRLPAVRTRSVSVTDIGRVRPVAVRKATGSPMGPPIAPKPLTATLGASTGSLEQKRLDPGNIGELDP